MGGQAEINAAYHRKRIERMLVDQIATLVGGRIGPGWEVVERILHFLVEDRCTRVAKRVVKKIKVDMTKNRKTEKIHNISNQLSNHENTLKNRKTGNARA